MTDRPPPPDNILEDAPSPARISRLAVTSFIISIIAALCFFLIVPPILTLIFAFIAAHRIVRNPTKLAGIGYTNAATTISICSCLLAILLLLLLPSLATRNPGISNRSSCAANLRGIMNSMVLYAAQNGEHFPAVTYAPYSPALNDPAGTPPHTAAGATAEDVVNSYFVPPAPSPQAGSVNANLWLLVLQGLSPKLFVCKFDPHATDIASLQAPSGRYYYNFQNDKQLSYSFAYPWKADGSVGSWWANASDASIPLGSDMAPEQGTGKPRRVLNSRVSTAAWSPGNHAGDGQNVVFGDVHVDYVKVPTVGTSNDNIWTTSANPSTGPSLTGIPADKSPPNLIDKGPPYDIIMYPIRNLDTGRF